jgi:antitoxin VapB
LEQIMAKTRVFRSGNSLAVRLPKEFGFKPGEVEIVRHKDGVLLRTKKQPGLGRLFDIVADMPDDAFDIPSDGPPQKRKGL